MKIRIAARKSDLARMQALDVGEHLQRAHPSVEIVYQFRESLGDKNLQDPLWKSPTKGVFTEDFLKDLEDGRCDMVVHSWKDLPTEPRAKTEIAATLKRADARDVLLVKKSAWNKNSKSFRIFTSSPRREYNLRPFLSWALPRPGVELSFESVRGNVQTRVRKLLEAPEVSALVVAKAALDRLLGTTADEFAETRSFLKKALGECRVMILPLSANPAAAAQGALAIEVRKNDSAVKKLLSAIHHEETFSEVEAERKILRSYGGGCHQKIGIHVHGRFKSLRGLTDAGVVLDEISFANAPGANPKSFALDESYPATPSEQAAFFDREPLPVKKPKGKALWVARADALPTDWQLTADDRVWTAGLETWRKLAERGIWVNGSSESLGEFFGMDVEKMLGPCDFTKLSHQESEDVLGQFGVRSNWPVTATYALVDREALPDLSTRKNFYWMSASSFLRAVEKYPNIALQGQHASGAGHTAEVVRKTLEKHGNERFFSFIGLRDWRKKTIRK